MPKYLFIQCSQPRQAPQPSPAQMQEMYATFNAWKEKFKDNILDMGAPLKPGGTVVTKAGATDGPFVEVKEIVGGWIHDRLRRQYRAGDRSGEGKPRGDVAGIERRGTGDAGGS